jgi:uracil-DNA glycosylase family 4
MLWSVIVSLRRRYLEQQSELGGAEIILDADRPVVPGPGEAPPDPEPVTTSPKRSELVSPEGPNDETRWKRDAPPIPGAGLTIDLPELSLPRDGPGVADTIDDIAAQIAQCSNCPLCEGRARTVPGEGDSAARLMLIGEGPGAKEDATGRPFVGAAGELLNGILKAINIPRESVFIANIVKCRPPQNRKPLPDEVAACLPYLRRQVALIRPKVIIALGGTAAESLLGVRKSLGQLREQVHLYGGIPLVVTYHPAALLRNPNWKKPTWDDVRIARQLLDR